MADTDNASPILRYNLVTQGVEYFQGSDFYPIAVAAPSGVSSLNTLTGAVTISAGSNITLTPSGNNIAIASTGGGISQVYSTYTPTIAGVTAASVGFNTVTAGTEKSIRGYFIAGSPTSTTFSISLPTPINTAHLPTGVPSILGTLNGTSNTNDLAVFFDGTDTANVYIWDNFGSGGSAVPAKATGSNFFNADDGVSCNFTYPI